MSSPSILATVLSALPPDVAHDYRPHIDDVVAALTSREEGAREQAVEAAREYGYGEQAQHILAQAFNEPAPEPAPEPVDEPGIPAATAVALMAQAASALEDAVAALRQAGVFPRD